MIDAVILTSNSKDLALECVRHTAAAAVVSMVVVVDNASSDGTVEHVGAGAPSAEVLHLSEHHGLARALNLGAARGSRPFILYLNDDVFATDGAIERLLAALLDDPGAVAAGGRLANDDLSTQDQYRPRDLPRAHHVALRLTGIDRLWPRNPITGGHLRHPLDDITTVPVGQPAGACLLVRRTDAEAIGGWDERFWFWYEDVDFSRRLATRGRSLYVPSAVFRHIGGATTTRWPASEMHRRTFYGMLVYARSHYGHAGRLLVGVTVGAVSAARYTLARFRRAPEARMYASMLRMVLDFLTGRPVRRPTA